MSDFSLASSDNRNAHRVLLVSSQKSLVKKITGLLKDAHPNWELNTADSGAKALTEIYQSPPALVVVDSTLADISGIQFCRVLKHDPVIRKIPIMMVTKESTKAYERFSELSLIADVFLEEKHLPEAFADQINMLSNLFRGLDADEQQQLKLLQQNTVRVQAVNRLVQLYDQSITEVTVMKGFRKLFELIPNKNVLNHMLFSLIENVVDYDMAGVFFNDKNREPRMMCYHIPENRKVKDEQLQDWTTGIFDELKAQCNEPWVFSATRYELLQADYMDDAGKPLVIKQRRIYPFFIENTLVGALVLFNHKEVNHELIFPFTLVMQEMSALMRLRHYYSEAETLALTDALTGLYTHQHFTWSLEREIRQAKRHQTPLTLALFSVDNLREINQQRGYDLGDKVMHYLGRCMLESVRSIDMLARAGGGKVSALFPNTGINEARNAVQRIQQMMLDNPLEENRQPVSLNLSIGIVTLGENIQSATDFMDQAEKAVVKARQKGQNCVELLQ